MQKKLIALAVAGVVSVPAMAQSNVTVYGRMDVGVMSKTNKAGDSEMRIDSSNWTTSRIGFKGSEDLGNGLKALFQVETKLTNDGDVGLGGQGRDTYVGLAGGFGAILAGRLSTTMNSWVTVYDPAGGGNAFRVTNPTFGGLETRANNTIAYASPAMGGFQAIAFYSLMNENKKDANGNKIEDDAFGIGLRYNNAGLDVSYNYHELDNVLGQHFLGASYDFGAVKVLGNYTLFDFDAAGAEEGQSAAIGVSVPVGNGTIYAGYGMERDVAGVANNDFDSFAVTYDHALSKRTSLYAGFRRVEPDRGDSKDNYGVGVYHKF